MKQTIALMLAVGILCCGCTETNIAPKQPSSQAVEEDELIHKAISDKPSDESDSFMPLGELSSACQNDYTAFANNLKDSGKKFIYLYVTTTDNAPVANLKSFSNENWDIYLKNGNSFINGLSMNSGLFPFCIEENQIDAQAFDIVVANTDTDTQPITEKITITAELIAKMGTSNILHIIWKDDTPHDTIRKCKRTLTMNTVIQQPKEMPRIPVPNVLLNNKLVTKIEETPTNPDNGSLNMDSSSSTSDALNKNATPVAFKDIFDPHYSDENGVIIFNLHNYPPDDILAKPRPKFPEPFIMYLFETEVAKDVYSFSLPENRINRMIYEKAKINSFNLMYSM